MSRAIHPNREYDRPLAVFDLDGTLVRGDSFLPFVLGYARVRRMVRPFVTVPVWVGLYAARLMPDHAAKQRVLASVFRGEPRTAVAEHADRFAATWIPPRLRDGVLARLREHQAAGHRVILLSASPDLYVPAVARHLGIDEVLCTRIRGDCDAWDGSIDGRNCKGEAKLAILCDHLGVARWPQESFAYGDSRSDLPVLHWATHGFLVGRRGGLRRVQSAVPSPV
jgi:phosphatidylglycerophosphatase C